MHRTRRIGLGTLLVVSLGAMGLIVGAAPVASEESVILPSVEDAYVVTDIANDGDPQHLRDTNFGTQDFIKVWYEFQVQGDEQDLSVGLVKFDLSPVADKDIRSSTLQLFAIRTDLADVARLVDVSLAEGAWSQQQVTFTSIPQISTPPLSTAAVYAANVWYSWDLTPGVVRKVRDGTMSVAVGLRTLENKKEEQVVFSSNRAGRNAPRLVVMYPATSPSLPLNTILIIAGGIALLMFVVGLLLGRIRRRSAPAPAPATSSEEDASREPPVPVQ